MILQVYDYNHEAPPLREAAAAASKSSTGESESEETGQRRVKRRIRRVMRCTKFFLLTE
jgi:hypothetical protein